MTQLSCDRQVLKITVLSTHLSLLRIHLHLMTTMMMLGAEKLTGKHTRYLGYEIENILWDAHSNCTRVVSVFLKIYLMGSAWKESKRICKE